MTEPVFPTNVPTLDKYLRKTVLGCKVDIALHFFVCSTVCTVGLTLLIDRSLRHIVTGLGPHSNGLVQESGFDITPASEIMAILCLSKDVDDLRRRIENILLGYTLDNKPFTVKDMGVAGSIVALLLDAMKPNLVQTTEGTPAFIHGGPFANIAHGCNSILATRMAMSFGDYVVTEAGFGADLGAEKFFDIKCRKSGLNSFATSSRT